MLVDIIQRPKMNVRLFATKQGIVNLLPIVNMAARVGLKIKRSMIMNSKTALELVLPTTMNAMPVNTYIIFLVKYTVAI